MPVSLGKNLSIEEYRINAIYTHLFEQLNVAYAWKNGDDIVYTTKTHEIGDNAYKSIEDSTDFLSITSTSDTNIVCSDGKTYEKNVDGNKSFKFIPVETKKETITTNEMLNITKPGEK